MINSCTSASHDICLQYILLNPEEISCKNHLNPLTILIVEYPRKKLDFTGFYNSIIPGDITQLANSSYEVPDLRDVGLDATLHF